MLHFQEDEQDEEEDEREEHSPGQNTSAKEDEEEEEKMPDYDDATKQLIASKAFSFLAPLAVGQQANVMAQRPLCVCQCVYHTPTKGRGGYTGVTLSVLPYISQYISLCVTKCCLGHNFKSIKASNFKRHTQIGNIAEKCSVQEQ